MPVTVHDSPYGGKYATFADGSRAPMPEDAMTEEETDILEELERARQLRNLRQVAPRLFL
jgi:hypothetical protein